MFNQNLFASKLEGLTPYKVDTNPYKVRLDANESFISMPENIREKFAGIMRKTDFNRYPDPDATALCKAFASFYGIDAQNVAAGNGSDEIISILMNGFADKGNTVLTFNPDFSMYRFYAELAELKCVGCEKNKDTLQIDFALADTVIKENGVKIAILSNPCNPTGRIEKKSDIVKLACDNPDTLFVIDEAYMDFASELSKSESFLEDVCTYSNIIVLKTLSKALGSAALRLGFVVADKSFCDMFKAVKSPYNVNAVSQALGEAILCEKDMLKDCIETITSSRIELFNEINKLQIADLAPMYTNFVFFSTPLAQHIFETLKEKGILVRKFDISGGSLRITTGSKEENELLLKELKNIV